MNFYEALEKANIGMRIRAKSWDKDVYLKFNNFNNSLYMHSSQTSKLYCLVREDLAEEWEGIAMTFFEAIAHMMQGEFAYNTSFDLYYCIKDGLLLYIEYDKDGNIKYEKSDLSLDTLMHQTWSVNERDVIR